MSDPRINKRTSRNVQRIANSLDNQMAYSRRSSYRSYRRYGRRYSSYGRSAKRRSYGEYRAANQQNDTSRQVLKWSNQQTITVNASANQGTSYFNGIKALRNSGFYTNFSKMYDQVKINAIRIKITLLSATNSIYSSVNNPVFVSAWDRNGISAPESSTDADAISAALTFTKVSSYGSAQTRTLTQGANFGVYRSIYASTMAEKSQYIPTGYLTSWDIDEVSDVLKFKPILLLAVYTAKTFTDAQELKFNVEWQFDVTFRGTRNDPNAGPA